MKKPILATVLAILLAVTCHGDSSTNRLTAFPTSFTECQNFQQVADWYQPSAAPVEHQSIWYFRFGQWAQAVSTPPKDVDPDALQRAYELCTWAYWVECGGDSILITQKMPRYLTPEQTLDLAWLSGVMTIQERKVAQ